MDLLSLLLHERDHVVGLDDLAAATGRFMPVVRRATHGGRVIVSDRP
jgi:hypothetical protein